MNTKLKVMVAVPSYDFKVDYSTVLSLLRAQEEAMERRWDVMFEFRLGDALIPRARNILASVFLTTDCTDLLFVDADVAWRKGSFAKLLSHDLDFVAGVYRMKREPEDYTVRALPGGFSPRADGLIEAAAVATGFMRVRRTVVEQLAEQCKDNWYEDPTAPKLKVYPMFDTPVIDHILWSEDFAFCRKWRELGGKIFIDSTLVLHHTGTARYGGSFGDWLARGMAAAGNAPAAAAAQPTPAPSVPATPTDNIIALAQAAARQ